MIQSIASLPAKFFSLKKISSKFHFIATGKVIKVKIKDDKPKVKDDKPKVSIFSKIRSKLIMTDKTKIIVISLLGLIFVIIIVTIITKNVFVIRTERQKTMKVEDPIKAMLIDEFRKEREKAFFWGQKNAIEGDIRIKKINDSTWIWAKSPWDDGTLATVTILHVDERERHRNERR